MLCHIIQAFFLMQLLVPVPKTIAQSSLSIDFSSDGECGDYVTTTTVPVNTCVLSPPSTLTNNNNNIMINNQNHDIIQINSNNDGTSSTIINNNNNNNNIPATAGSLNVENCDNGRAKVKAFNDTGCTMPISSFVSRFSLNAGGTTEYCWGGSGGTQFVAFKVTCNSSVDIDSNASLSTTSLPDNVMSKKVSSTSAILSSVSGTTSTSDLSTPPITILVPGSSSANTIAADMTTSSSWLSRDSSSFGSSTTSSLSISTLETVPAPVATPSTSSSAPEGLSQSDRIAVGVGLSIGIPGLMLSAWQLYVMRKRKKDIPRKGAYRRIRWPQPTV